MHPRGALMTAVPGAWREARGANPSFHHSELADLSQCQEPDLKRHQPMGAEGPLSLTVSEGSWVEVRLATLPPPGTGLSCSCSAYELPVAKMRVFLRKGF